VTTKAYSDVNAEQQNQNAGGRRHQRKSKRKKKERAAKSETRGKDVGGDINAGKA